LNNEFSGDFAVLIRRPLMRVLTFIDANKLI